MNLFRKTNSYSPSPALRGRAGVGVFLFLFSFLSSIFAQEADLPTTLQGWAAKQQKAAKSFPQEEVFVHMDNTCYFLGDTIYYKAYVTRSDTHLPTNVSKVLYVELFNQDGYLLERQIMKLTDGQAHGSFCLVDTLYPGYHELRAYTRWQLNWGAYEHPHNRFNESWFLSKDIAKEFYQDYEKLYSRVFPVFDKPLEPGAFDRDMSLRPLRRAYKPEEEKRIAEVAFFPEGGTWIAGLPQVLAFEANSPMGRHLEGKLTVFDATDNIVAEAETEHRGRGSVTLTGSPGTKLHAVFTWGEGYTSKVDLPKMEESGAVMHVENTGQALEVEIQTRGLSADSLGLSLSSKGQVVHYQSVTDGKLTIPTTDCPSGVAQLTLFDIEGRVLSDRMNFVRGDDVQPASIQFTGIPDQCQPFQQVKIGVKAPGKSTISLAIRDQKTSEYINDDSNILTELLLCSHIKGFVEQPGYYFAGDDEPHRRHLDLLLLVQGWRRYRWEDLTSKFTMRQPFEQHRIVQGEIYKYTPLDCEDIMFPVEKTTTEEPLAGSSGPRFEEYYYLSEEEVDSLDIGMPTGVTQFNGQTVNYATYQGRYAMLANMKVVSPDSTNGMARHVVIYNPQTNDPAEHQFISEVKDNVLLHAEFTQPRQEGVVGDVTVPGGRFNIDIPNFDEYCFFFLAAAKERKKDVKSWIVTDANEYPEYYVRLKNFYPRFVKPYNYYQTQLASFVGKTYQPNTSASLLSTDLREVTIRSNRRGVTGFNINKPVATMDALEAVNQLYDAGLSPGWYSGNIAFMMQFSRLLVGDMGVERSYPFERRFNGKIYTHGTSTETFHLYNHLENLDRVQLFTDYAPRQEGDRRYEGSEQPIVSVNLERFEDNSIRTTWRDRRYILPGYNVCEEFYQPNYKKKPLPTTKDYRRTLYWNPDLELDDRGRAEVQFYNNSQTTLLTISAEGLSPEGTPYTGISMPEDRY